MTEMPHSQEHGFDQIIEDALSQPIPNMDALRERKIGYSELPIDTTHPKFHEPIVDIAVYGIAGQAYYSRPNAATKDPVPGTPSRLLLRKSITETLANINAGLRHPSITEFFGGEVELYVEDALRPVSLQSRLHAELIPALLRKNHPDVDVTELMKRRDGIIAIPSTDPRKPSPHATGGTLDIILRYKQPAPNYVENVNVLMGHSDGDTGHTINPDYFEQTEPLSDADKMYQRNRRAFYCIMTGLVFSKDTGFINNPTEFWHWGRGDQLSEKVRGSDAAYYSLAEV